MVSVEAGAAAATPPPYRRDQWLDCNVPPQPEQRNMCGPRSSAARSAAPQAGHDGVSASASVCVGVRRGGPSPSVHILYALVRPSSSGESVERPGATAVVGGGGDASEAAARNGCPRAPLSRTPRSSSCCSEFMSCQMDAAWSSSCCARRGTAISFITSPMCCIKLAAC